MPLGMVPMGRRGKKQKWEKETSSCDIGLGKASTVLSTVWQGTLELWGSDSPSELQ